MYLFSNVNTLLEYKFNDYVPLVTFTLIFQFFFMCENMFLNN